MKNNNFLATLLFIGVVLKWKLPIKIKLRPHTGIEATLIHVGFKTEKILSCFYFLFFWFSICQFPF